MRDVGTPCEEAQVRALHDHFQQDVHVVVVRLGVEIPCGETRFELVDDADVFLEVGGVDDLDDAPAEVDPVCAGKPVEDVGLDVALEEVEECGQAVILCDRNVVVLDGEVVSCGYEE